MSASLFSSPPDPRAVRLIPLGGCGEFGMNLTAYLSRGKLHVIDCGVRFPDPQRLGVDAVLPHVDPFFEVAGGVSAYYLTHGHEDHLGAMPHVLPRWPAPVYGTAWTMALLRNKLVKLGLNPEKFQLLTVSPGDRVGPQDFSVEFIHLNHSIPQTCALFVRTPQLRIFHTGDFKLDPSPLGEAPADLARLKALGDEGVDVLLADSTNAEKAGTCPGEGTVLEPMKKVFAAARGAIIISTFSSNLWRLMTICDAAAATGRKIYVAGNGIENTLNIARELGLYELPVGLRIGDEDLGRIPREQLVVMATGCQGEWRAGMARIAAGEHRTVKIQDTDTAVISARVIPGNEKSLLNMTNQLIRAGARVITTRENNGLHVSGHAYGGDLETMVKLLRPKRLLPVHGAFSQLRANLMRLAAAGEQGQAQLIETGDVIDVTRESLTMVGAVDVELDFVDEGGAGVLISYQELRERLRVGELGAVLVTGVLEASSMTWRVPLTLDTVGLSIAGGEGSWREKAVNKLTALASQLVGKHASPDEIQEELRVALRRQLSHLLKKKPVVTVRLHII